MIRPSRIALFLMIAWGSAPAYERIIFDTDMLTDFDDVGALACLHSLADAGECEILATVSSTRGNASVAAIEVINGYYGRPDIPVGSVKGMGIVGENPDAKTKVDPKSPLGVRPGGDGGHFKYRKLARDYPHWVEHLDADDAPDANLVYRKVLSMAQDGSVVICTTGFLTNLRRLLETKGDEFSPLDGRELVAKKVKRLVAMAGSYPKGAEYNLMCDAESARIVLEQWPTPILFSDFQYGCDVFCGRKIAESGCAGANPVREIFRENLPTREEIARDPGLWGRRYFGVGGRASWDETAVLAAVRGAEPYFRTCRGRFRMSAKTGEDEWTDEANGPHSRIAEMMPKAQVAAVIDELICRGPVSWNLDREPIGGVHVDSRGALSRKELKARLDAVELENANKPFIVTRAAQMVEIMDHVRLAVNTNNVFVHWHPDGRLMELRRNARIAAWRKGAPERDLIGRWYDATDGAWLTKLDTSHTCPDWESVLSLGPKGLADRARERLKTAKDDEARLFLGCVADVYEAMSRLCVRWSDAARRHGMTDCADVLKEIAVHPPRTFREALQLSLIYDRVQEDEGECVRAQGLFDRLFIKFYRADLAAGRETRESAKALIKGLFDCYYTQNHPNCKNIAFGGYDDQGCPVWNELTELGFEVHRELNRPNPKLTFRYGRMTPQDQLEKVARCLAEGRTSVVFGNEEVLAEMFARQGKDRADIASSVLVGCYEPGIQGREIVASMAGEMNLTKPLEAVLNGGRDFKGRQVGPRCPLPANGDAFEQEYLRQLGAMTDAMLGRTRMVEEEWYELNPSPVMSGAFRDCVDNGRDCSRGGCKYNQSGIMCAGLGTVADSLAAVRYLVDERKLVTMKELSNALKGDWKGFDVLRREAMRGAPKWGNNDDRADAAAKRVYEFLTAKINGEKNGHGGTYQAGFWSICNDIYLGELTGATPDGRLAGSPISRNNVATAGCGKEGPTALLGSLAKLDQANSPDGFIADVIVPVSKIGADRGAKVIAGLLSGYAAMGGQSIHLNVFDSAILRDAMAHPERYEDLQVRVCGWNVRWNDLSRAEQLHFLKTAEAQEGI